ncbi:hypothetical protein LOTGIDRAFT_196690 [Lottia gigantea]|uniref:Polypeptide N-acetylgalactosaminyltransferase n=1 Tax=Lottia gigantea TaxID=225164 RepID=V4B7C0_LOTGI|nr:hypothetical protein LOTGIDRAFT_196690 [Lottia gigantea]ESO84474.1 hypothetical protein LOTGIDRAFT_196690 [Lottia gigantea]
MRKKRKIVFLCLILVWFCGTIYIFWDSLLGKPGTTHTKYDIKTLGLKRYINSYNEEDVQEPVRRHGFNILVSNKIPPDRTIPDARSPKCLSHFSGIPQFLPTTSIIIVFYNEARSALLRTIVSILKRTPEFLLEEILLIDDFSENIEDGSALVNLPKIKLVRNQNREGLIRSRVKGAKLAKGRILTFLDSHCEVNIGWLPPLIQRLSQEPRSVVTPVIDPIDKDSFDYEKLTEILRGGFDWSLNFRWEEQPIDIRKKDEIQPVRTPVMSGSAFSVQKDYFMSMGSLDTKMDIWGGENFELSFRIWMCGGSINIIPCSRVGHILRKKHPYRFPDGNVNTYLRNTRRVAEMWMDEYKRFFYAARPSSRMQTYGDLSERRNLRIKLKCQNFRWYLEHIYPQLQLPVSDELAYGHVKQGDYCLDLDPGQLPVITKIRLCSESKEAQDWSWRRKGIIVSNGMCLTSDPLVTHLYVVVQFCNYGDNQRWYRHEKQIVHESSGMCIDSYMANKGLVLADCDNSLDSQHWQLSVENSASLEKDYLDNT